MAADEAELKRTRGIAFTEMEQAAAELRADAIVGVALDDEMVGGEESMLMVSVSGVGRAVQLT